MQVVMRPREFALRVKEQLLHIFLLVACFSQAVAAESPRFPVPRAEEEFRELMQVPEGWSASGNVTFEGAFVALMPYGPLDLQVTGDATHEEISTLRNFYLGSTCYKLGIDPRRVMAVFNCGLTCVESRRNDIRDNIDKWLLVAEKFRAASGVRLIGMWAGPGAIRVNDVVKLGDKVLIAIPSPKMGFIPGGRFIQRENLKGALSERHIDIERVQAVIGAMSDTHSVAVHYGHKGWIEVVKIGIADNVSGVLFASEGGMPPSVGEVHSGGGEYIFVEKVGRNAYFFETR